MDLLVGRFLSPRVSPSRAPFFLAPITFKKMTKSQLCIVSNKYVSEALYQTLQTMHTNEIWKTLRIISFQKAQLPSISIFCNTVHSKFLSFFFALLFICYCHVLSRYFCFTKIGGGSHCLNLDKFRDTVPLKGISEDKMRRRG